MGAVHREDTEWQLAVLSPPIFPVGLGIDMVAARVRCATGQMRTLWWAGLEQ